MKKAKNEKRLKNILFRIPALTLCGMVIIIWLIENILLYQYIVSETGDYMAERFEVLDSYYYDTGYEGYYEKNEEYHVSVYHMILDEEKNVIFPYEEYEEKESWSTIEAIARQVRAKGNSKEKKGKIRSGEAVYYYKNRFYEGRFDDFFIREDKENPEKYEVIAYANVSVIESFVSYT